MRLTYVADTEQLFRLIQSIPSKKAEPFKQWMAQVARERLDQMADPELAIDQAISEACGGNERAAYGQHVLEYISERLTAEFGKGFTVRNLRNMRAFYVAFPKRHALRSELS